VCKLIWEGYGKAWVASPKLTHRLTHSPPNPPVSNLDFSIMSSTWGCSPASHGAQHPNTSTLCMRTIPPAQQACISEV
jgi:hypothetical protein